MNATPSRIEAARLRAAGAKQVAAVVAAAGFVAVLLLARGSHPGRVTTSSGTSGGSQATSESEQNDDGFDFGSGSVSPSSGSAQPQAQTSVS